MGFTGSCWASLPSSNNKKIFNARWISRGSPFSLFVFTFLHHRFTSPIPIQNPHNQYYTTTPSINSFFMISIQFTLSLLLYILIFSPECKPNPKTFLTSIRDETEWKIPDELRLWWKGHVLPRCHTGSSCIWGKALYTLSPASTDLEAKMEKVMHPDV